MHNAVALAHGGGYLEIFINEFDPLPTIAKIDSLLREKGQHMSSKFLSNIELRTILSKSSPEERKALSMILSNNQEDNWSAEKIQYEICAMGGHSITNAFRGEGTSYLDILDDIISHLKIKDELPTYNNSVSGWFSLEDIDCKSSLVMSEEQCLIRGIKYAEIAEEKITLHILQKSYEQLAPSEKIEFDKKINEIAIQQGSDPTNKLIGAAGILALGNLGGFATYTFLTTAMSTLSFGALSFGAYTTATSALSVALGPVGWIGLGATALYAYGKPKYQKLIPAVTVVGAIRQRLEFEGQHTYLIKESKMSYFFGCVKNTVRMMIGFSLIGGVIYLINN